MVEHCQIDFKLHLEIHFVLPELEQLVPQIHLLQFDFVVVPETDLLDLLVLQFDFLFLEIDLPLLPLHPLKC